MSLIQRNTVPLFILLAIAAIGAGVLFSRNPVPVALGESPPGCNASTVGITILATDAQGPVSVTQHGDTLSYQVILSIPELPAGDTACNYGEGNLSVILPNGEERMVAGGDTGIPIDTVSVGNPFQGVAVSYTVDQTDASVDSELTARAVYSDGISLSVPEGEDPPEAAASVSSTIRITPPSIDMAMGPDTQTVYQGQRAVFEITLTNTGGFALSNATISDADAPECNVTVPMLAVGEVMTLDRCSVVATESFTNEASVTAQVIGGVAPGTQVTASDSVDVIFAEVEVDISIQPAMQIVRADTEANLTISVFTPSVTDLNDVTVTVNSVGAGGGSTELTECSRDFGTVLAAAGESPYTCAVTLPAGRNVITATVTGTLPGTTRPLPAASDSAEVQVIAPGLAIVAAAGAESVAGVPTVRKGESTSISITVYNNGDSELLNLAVASKSGYPDVQNCGRNLSALGSLGPDESMSIDCSSANLEATTEFVFVATGVAEDNSMETAESDPISVDILDPSTAIGISQQSDAMMLRFAVHTLSITETNDGDSPLSSVRVDLSSEGVVPLNRDPLTRESSEYVSGDVNDNSLLDPGETWEWRVVILSVAGDIVLLAPGATQLEVTATGYGVDELNGEVTYPGDVDEIGTITVPIMGP